ncbi:putative functions as an U snRNP-specific nuclear import adapter [Lyophyllum shimeji]|uniref:Snurportin-1 n=1 Tax=Lyophyllum shimeji TaxID=47721 RepID=A0A9P3UPS2_LYOSH|nr:putative functions as an U snRNP-specific nuclear import adapter [Lyophyllum shimeji]
MPVAMDPAVNLFAARKTSYKLPPTTITDRLVSQEARRTKALEEQKRRRAQRIDSTRQLDRFADLTLGSSEDEAEAEEEEQERPALGSVAPYAGMLREEVDPSTIATHVVAPTPPPVAETALTTGITAAVISEDMDQDKHKQQTKEQAATKKKKKTRRKKNKPNKWADRCMYAELLEMSPAGDGWGGADGLPSDLESGWVAVGPVPVGKRCLAVTQVAVGVPGTVPNTTLRSRLLGKILIPRFPSSLPPHTILDCILDARWRENGILHILDVVKWKGQDVSECESAFRFWWRDTRLAELTPTNPPSPPPPPEGPRHNENEAGYRFPYPTSFVPVPYHTDTTLPMLLTHVVPLSRAPHTVPITLPLRDVPRPAFNFGVTHRSGEGMEVDASKGGTERGEGEEVWEFGRGYVQTEAQVMPDGLLLYVKEASYESGTSPLSSWIPIVGYAEGQGAGAAQGQGQGQAEGPLDLFERLVHRRLLRAQTGGGAVVQEVEMEM